ncbi:hypothetical protein I4U23_015499 [Adineta vaga]|nr:hypothetical protein I4U23_015499 [Adineta vaga]
MSLIDAVKNGGKVLLGKFNKLTTNDEPRKINIQTDDVAKLLIIGETGCGKSTFINYLVNYFRGGSLKNLRVAIPSVYRLCVTEEFGHTENAMHDTTKSQTDACHQYAFEDPKTKKAYLFLDTPGLSDTRGAEQDDINIFKIIDAVESLGGLTTVIIVVNGTTPRITLNSQNVITRLRGNLPDSVMESVIVVLTNAKRHASNFKIQALGLTGDVYPFYFQNSAFSKPENEWDSESLPQLERDWRESMNNIKRMLLEIDKLATKSVSAFTEMKAIRNEIMALMHKIKMEVIDIQKMQDEIAAFESAVQKYGSDALTFEDFTKEIIQEHKQHVPADYHSTLCTVCDFVCHDGCALQETVTLGDQIFVGCWAMDNGFCQQCPGIVVDGQVTRCSFKKHYHARKTIKISKTSNKRILHEIKAQYEQAAQNKTEFEGKLTSATQAKTLLAKALEEKYIELQEKCKQLRALCHGFDIVEELRSLIAQLQASHLQLHDIEAKQQSEKMIRGLTEFCQMIGNEQCSDRTLPPMRLIDNYQSGQQQQTEPATSTTPLPSNISIWESRAQKNQNQKGDSKRKKQTSVESTHQSNSDDTSDTSLSSDESSTDEAKVTKRKSKSNKEKKIKEKNRTLTSGRTKTDKNIGSEESENDHKTSFKKERFPETALLCSMNTHELIGLYSTCTNVNEKNLIIEELRKRAEGRSSQAPYDKIQFANIYREYSSYDLPQLRQRYDQMQQKINETIEQDILHIIRVNPKLLTEISVIYLLIHPTNDDQFHSHPQQLPYHPHEYYTNQSRFLNTNYSSNTHPQLHYPYHSQPQPFNYENQRQIPQWQTHGHSTMPVPYGYNPYVQCQNEFHQNTTNIGTPTHHMNQMVLQQMSQLTIQMPIKSSHHPIRMLFVINRLLRHINNH